MNRKQFVVEQINIIKKVSFPKVIYAFNVLSGNILNAFTLAELVCFLFWII